MDKTGTHLSPSLGQYEEELAVLRRLWEEQPAFFGTTWFRGNEARALAALGRIEECRSVVAEAMTEPTYGPDRYGGLMVGVAAELRMHGHGEESRAMAERALEWFERTELPPETEISALESSIEVLDLLGRHREAYELTRVLLAAKPDRWQSQARIGVAAARTGDDQPVLPETKPCGRKPAHAPNDQMAGLWFRFAFRFWVPRWGCYGSTSQ